MLADNDGEMKMQKFVAMAGVAGLALFAGSSAEAALLSIIGGTAQVVQAPGPGSLGNDVVGQPNNILNTGDTILSGALLRVDAAATLKYYFTGAEAKFLDTLDTSAGSRGNQPNGLVDVPGELFATAAAASGFAGFSFTIDTNGDGTPEFTIVNSDTGPDANGSNAFRSFALAYLDDLYRITQTATNRVGIFLDDSGQNADTDFDDWVGYVEASSLQAVPLPASVPLFLAGLAGLGLIGHRRKQA